MAAPENGERRTDLKAQLLERLHDPLQLRLALIGLVLLVGYFAIYSPLSKDIARTTKMLKRERAREELGGSIEQLQAQCKSYNNRLPQQADSKEWMQYLLDGIRGFSLELRKLDCESPKSYGPYQAVVFKIELAGSFYELDRFLRWLETNPRLFRTDQISISLAEKAKKGRQNSNEDAEVNKDDMVMRLTVCGMAG